jgi:hypothetical protein
MYILNVSLHGVLSRSRKSQDGREAEKKMPHRTRSNACDTALHHSRPSVGQTRVTSVSLAREGFQFIREQAVVQVEQSRDRKGASDAADGTKDRFLTGAALLV